MRARLLCPAVSEGNQRFPALHGEPADEQPKHRLKPRVQDQRDGGSDESDGERERDASTEGITSLVTQFRHSYTHTHLKCMRVISRTAGRHLIIQLCERIQNINKLR